MNRGVITALLILFPLLINAQVGNYRNNFSIGGNAGYALSNVGFDPKSITVSAWWYYCWIKFKICMRKVFQHYLFNLWRNKLCFGRLETRYTNFFR